MNRIQNCCRLLATLIVAVCHGSVVGMPANPNLIIADQPDGSKVVLRIYGDETHNWQTDVNDYWVKRNANGAYVYVTQTEQAEPVVGKVDPVATGAKKGTPPRPGAEGLTHPDRLITPKGAEPAKRTSATGAVKNLVILMKYSNHTGRTLPTTSDVEQLFNAVGGHPTLAPTGSVRDVYLANSYGTFQLNSTVYAWVTLPKTEQYYADRVSGMGPKMHEAIRDALTLADPLIDFKDFDKDGDGFVDAIAFLHSGYGAEWGGTDSDGTDYTNRIWSHRWSIPTWTSAEGVKVSPYHISPSLWGTSGANVGRIGVICHETGHFFGLPDLYDGGAGSGIGSWCMMANSWGFDGSQYYPPNFCGWCKIKLGWVTPTIISAAGTYTATASATTPVVFRITAGYPTGEYLLIENRQAIGTDQKIPTGTGGRGGIAIWHVDEKKGTNTDPGYPGQAGYPGNNKHYMVALLQADGYYDLEKRANRGDGDDVYRSGFKTEISHSTVPNTDAYQDGVIVDTNNTISNISTSGSTMTFNYSATATSPATR